ncbi:flippase-like domain-containing protein [Nocardioides panacis]|uniref:Flippase-like domain-containing protein n=1 Tax=Nocardioides panacis TaxID=2849501 RepID=A0A975T3K2_9ACTN|nr:flippase-like domain-containing protein [Nocardioides panacis]
MAGAGVLVLLVARVGAGPFVDGLRALDAWAVGAASAVTVATTVCGAWRWRLVAAGLGLDLPLRTAVAASYRAQLLNTTLPGGVVGDVHRGVRHGREVRATGRALRAVAWERVAGQVTQGAVAVVVLLVLPSPVRSSMPRVLLVAVAAAAVGLLVVRVAVPVLRTDLHALATRGSPLGVALLSGLAVVGHLAVFWVAARTAGVPASPVRLLPLALLVLLAMAVPTNVAGWGPREGVAAWAFSAAGLGASAGVATAVTYGVLVLVASLPGVVVLVVDSLHRHVELEAARG